MGLGLGVGGRIGVWVRVLEHDGPLFCKNLNLFIEVTACIATKLKPTNHTFRQPAPGRPCLLRTASALASRVISTQLSEKFSPGISTSSKTTWCTCPPVTPSWEASYNLPSLCMAYPSCKISHVVPQPLCLAVRRMRSYIFETKITTLRLDLMSCD